MMLAGNCCITIEIFFFVPFNAPEGKRAKRFGGVGAMAGKLSEGGYAGGGVGCR